MREEDERKSVITMASFALQTPPRVVHASRLGQFEDNMSAGGIDNLNKKLLRLINAVLLKFEIE